MRFGIFPEVALGLAAAAKSETLFASHYSGQIYTLQLQNLTSRYDLSISSQITGCGGLPAWLTYDAASRALYCSDETMSGQGSVSSFTAARDGRLTPTGKATAPAGGVANVLYGGGDGKSYIAIAHYQSSQISTFKLPITSSSKPLQSLKFTMSRPGPNPWRQDAPHPHHVAVDPSGQFLLSPDLGADIVRVWKITSESGTLTACPSLTMVSGSGPRHLTFASSTDSERVSMFVASELANTITAFMVSSRNGACPAFTHLNTLSPFANNATAPAGTKVAEVHNFGSRLYSTSRVDKTFSGNDSVALFDMESQTGLRFTDLQSSWGTYPRTFSINKAGTLLAVGDQTTANVAILRIDGGMGKLTRRPIANIRIGPTGTPESEDGLSSVVFAD